MCRYPSFFRGCDLTVCGRDGGTFKPEDVALSVQFSVIFSRLWRNYLWQRQKTVKPEDTALRIQLPVGFRSYDVIVCGRDGGTVKPEDAALSVQLSLSFRGCDVILCDKHGGRLGQGTSRGVLGELDVRKEDGRAGGFFSRFARILGECSTSHSPPALFLLLLLLFVSLFLCLEVEISSRTLIPIFMPGSVHSGSAR